MVSRFTRVERLEVEVFDWLRGERVKRAIPDYETLELARPEDVIEAKNVQVRAKVQPGYLSSALFSLASAAPGPRWQPIPAGEARLLHGGVSYSFTSNAVDPRYLYALLHGVGCRLIASLLLGARPRDEVERLLFEKAVVDAGEKSYQRVVILERLLPPELVHEKGWRDPWALVSLRFWTEVELLRMAALAVAAARPEKWIPYPPWSPRPSFFLRVYEKDLEVWLRDAAAFEETAKRCGIPFARPEPLPPPVDGETVERALASLHLLLTRRSEVRGFMLPPENVLPRVANAFADYGNVVLVDMLME